MKKYGELFGKIYNFIYNTHNEFMDIAENTLISIGEDAIKNDKDFKGTMQAFIDYRGDLLTSDREIAAFTATYMYINKLRF